MKLFYCNMGDERHSFQIHILRFSSSAQKCNFGVWISETFLALRYEVQFRCTGYLPPPPPTNHNRELTISYGLLENLEYVYATITLLRRPIPGVKIIVFIIKYVLKLRFVITFIERNKIGNTSLITTELVLLRKNH